MTRWVTYSRFCLPSCTVEKTATAGWRWLFFLAAEHGFVTAGAAGAEKGKCAATGRLLIFDPIGQILPFLLTVLHSQKSSHRRLAMAVFWLRNTDSNRDKQIQRLSCYPYTIPQCSARNGHYFNTFSRFVNRFSVNFGIIYAAGKKPEAGEKLSGFRCHGGKYGMIPYFRLLCS